MHILDSALCGTVELSDPLPVCRQSPNTSFLNSWYYFAPAIQFHSHAFHFLTRSTVYALQCIFILPLCDQLTSACPIAFQRRHQFIFQLCQFSTLSLSFNAPIMFALFALVANTINIKIIMIDMCLDYAQMSKLCLTSDDRYNSVDRLLVTCTKAVLGPHLASYWIAKMSGKMGGFVDSFDLACWPEC